MALALTYPGVYVQSIVQPSPPNAGVPTSLAAFIGRASMGPVNEPKILNSWGDYQRFFGGLASDSSISYQVNAFFNNGGGQAIGVRLFYPNLPTQAAIDEVTKYLTGTAIAAATAALNAVAPSGKVPVATAQTTVLNSLNTTAASAVGNNAWGIAQLIALASDKTQWPPGTSDPSGGDSIPGGGDSVSGAADSIPGGGDSVSGGGDSIPGGGTSSTLVYTVSAVGDYLTYLAESKLNKKFTAAITIDPVASVANALDSFMESISLQAEFMPASAPLASLLTFADQAASSYAQQPGVPDGISKLTAALAAATTVTGAVAAMKAAYPNALYTALNTIVPTSAPKGGEAAFGKVTASLAALSALAAALPTISPVVTSYNAALAVYTANPAAKGPDLAAAITATDAGSKAVHDAINKVAAGGIAALVAGYNAAIPKIAPPLGPNTAALVATPAASPEAPSSPPTFNACLTGDPAAIQEALSTAWTDATKLTLTAANPGTWGNEITATVDLNGINPQTAARFKVDQSELFNLTITYTDSNGNSSIETYNCVVLDPTNPTRFLGSMLEQQSQFVRYAPPTEQPLTPFNGASGTGQGGQDSQPLDLTTYLGDENKKTGIYALEKTPIFNILCIPPDIQDSDTDPFIYQTAAAYCARPTVNAMLIIDPPTAWTSDYKAGNVQNISLNNLGSFGTEEGDSTAVYFPRIVATDPLTGKTRVMPNSGYMAGVWAQTDTSIGVWKAPAGLDAAINGIVGLEVTMNDAENGMLNPLGINCLRTFPIGGSVVWGARTLRGADQLADEYKYVPVRRTLLYIMDWALQNTKWAVFQPNDERLWSALRLQIGGFMLGLWKQGALFGASADKAFFVKCDATTTTPTDINSGRVNVQIGFCPVRPAEFVVVTVQQIALSAS